MLKFLRRCLVLLLAIQILWQVPALANDKDDFSLQQEQLSDATAGVAVLRFVGDEDRPLFEITVSAGSDIFTNRDTTLNFCEEFSTKNFSGLRKVISSAYEPDLSEHLMEGLVGSVWWSTVCPSLFEGSDQFTMRNP